MKEKFEKRLNAKVVLCKCPNHHNDDEKIQASSEYG
jgi:hypothetical protein